MTLRVMLLLGLLGLVLLVIGLVDSIIRLVTRWLFATSIISWILSAFPNFMFNVAVAAVQAVLLSWSLSSILCLILHVKVQRMTLSHDPNPAVSKLGLSFDKISYTHQDIVSNIRSMKITLDIDPNVSPWIMVSIINPCVTMSIAKGAHNRNENSLPTNDPQTAVPNYLKWLLNIKNGGLLQLLLRHVKFCVKNGTVRVVDRTHEALSVNLHCEEFGLREHRSIHEDLMYTNAYKQLYVRKFSTKISVGPKSESGTSATFYCNYFSLHMANVAGVRRKAYNSKTMNTLLGRQYWKFDVWIQLVSFYLGTYELNENVRKRGEVFFARQVDIKMANIRKEGQETGKLQIKVELPICLEYSPKLAKFVVWMFRCIAHYRPDDADNRANREMVTIPTSCQTFPAALDMVIHVALGKVTCLFRNSCVILKNLTMKKSNRETNILVSSVSLNYNTPGYKILTVDEIEIKHLNPYLNFQQLFINLKNINIHWKPFVHDHIKQMIEETEEMRIEIKKLSTLRPPSAAANPVLIEILVDTLKVFIPPMFNGLIVCMVVDKMKAVNDRKWIINVYDAVIYGFMGPVNKHPFLCFESVDYDTGGSWTITTHNKGRIGLNNITFCMVVFDGVPIVYKCALIAFFAPLLIL